MRISCPPHVSPCFYGIDFPSKEELLACNNSMEEIKKYLDVESIGYLSIEGMLGAASQDNSNYCAACFSGNYPTRLFDDIDKLKLERKRL